MSSYNAAEMMSAEAEKRFDEMYGGKVPNIAPRKKKDGGQRERIAELEVVNQELDARLSAFKKELAAANAKIEKLNAERAHAEQASTSEECTRLRKENAELKHKLDAALAPSESDTTRIVRYAPCNPVDEAIRKFEERTKVNANCSTDSADSGRASIETVEYRELKLKYDKLVIDGDKRSQLYKGVVRNLRFAVASLTGFEFKIYDDHVEVACKKSADDVFKFCIDGDKVEVLDTSSVQRYKAQMDRYIGSLNSIPCFLASVVMTSEGVKQ